MADLTPATAGRVWPVSGVANGHEQFSFEAAEAIEVGQLFYINTAGRAVKASAGAVGTVAQSGAGVFNSELFVAIDAARQAGNAVTGMKKGELDGWDLTALAIGAAVYAGNTAGALSDTAGTIATIVGRVRAAPYTGAPSGADKVLAVNCPPVV